MVIASLGPTLPALADQTGSSIGRIGILFITRALGYLFGSLFVSHLYDRVRAHRLAATVLFITALLMGSIPLYRSFWILATVMLLIGVAESTLDVGINTLLMWLHGERVPPFMNGLHFFFGIGAFAAPIIIARTGLWTGSMVAAYPILGALMLPAAVWIALMPSPSVETSDPSQRPAHPGRGVIVLFAAFFFLYVGSEIAFSGWLYTYAFTLGLATETTAAYLTSAYWGAFTIGRFLAIPLGSRMAPKRLLQIDIWGAAAGLALLFLFPRSQTVLWVGSALVGLCMASSFPTAMSMAERRIPISGRITGWFFAGASTGGMLIPAVIGAGFDRIGPGMLMAGVCAVMVMAGGLVAVLVRRTQV
jgi:FHS family Na+ dependent glucose MFS transporter 1